MNPTTWHHRRLRLTRQGAVLVAAALTALGVGGCTIGGGGPDEPSGEAASPSDGTSGTGGTDEPEREQTPDGPSPQELSADLLAASAQSPQPLGSVTAVIPPVQVETTMEVLEIRPVEGATFVVLRLTAPGEAFNVGPTTFADGRFGTQNFVRDIYLDDVAGGARYLPLQFQDYRDACVCPYKPLELGPEAQVVTALFPALPDGTTTVDLSLGGTELVLTGLPVG